METQGFAIKFENLPDKRLSEIERDFVKSLANKDVLISKRNSTPVPGERGLTLDVGTIIVTFMTSGAAVALIECVKAYVSRSNKLVLKFSRPSGETFEVNSENINSSEIKDMIESLGHISLEESKNA